MPVLVGRKIKVADVISQAKAQGCELRVSRGQLVTPDGTYRIRFLFNPATRGRFDITDYNDDEFMLESEISACERRLDIRLA